MIRRRATLSLSVVAGCLVAPAGLSSRAGMLPPVAPPVTATAATGSAGDYVAPVAGPVVVVRALEPPPGPYAAGHRGVDLATGRGSLVRAAQSGVVRFAGQIAGRGVVVIVHGDGVRTEYEPVAPSVASGAVVRRGEAIGSLAGNHGTCRPSGCLHWGAQREGRYFDPTTLLAPLGVVRLVPWSDAA